MSIEFTKIFEVDVKREKLPNNKSKPELLTVTSFGASFYFLFIGFDSMTLKEVVSKILYTHTIAFDILDHFDSIDKIIFIVYENL